MSEKVTLINIVFPVVLGVSKGYISHIFFEEKLLTLSKERYPSSTKFSKDQPLLPAR